MLQKLSLPPWLAQVRHVSLSGLLLSPSRLSLGNLLESSCLVVPLQGLKLAQFASEECAPNVASTSYDLYAVSNHIGSLVGGHYTAHCLTRTPQVRYNRGQENNQLEMI